MAIFEPGPMEKFGLWLKGLTKPIRATAARSAQISPMDQTSVTVRTLLKRRQPKKIWSRDLDQERRVEVIAREDELFSFREMKRVTDDTGTVDLLIYESGLYDDLKEITLATSDYIRNDRQRTRS